MLWSATPMSDPTKSNYSKTVLLGETTFAMKGELAKREPQIIDEWKATDLYGRIQAARADAPLWVLHDGPPYSNGHIHYGHILNKILKDVVIKSRTMTGFRTPYVPGWDTHGLPIEKAIETELKGKRWEMKDAEVRQACRAYALKYVDIQREEFQRLGVLGDWGKPYLTLDHTYEAAIVRALAKFTRDGYLYRGKKPVQWCPRDRTALATSEIEFKDKSSPSVYVKMALLDRGSLDPRLDGKRLAYVIWTTTPWTLPANLAIVAHPKLTYVALPNPGDAGEYLIVAQSLAPAVIAAIGGGDLAAAIEITPAQMATLEGGRYQHPFVPSHPDLGDAAFRLWFADYVEDTAGTGLVHTAPGHGADDYRTGVAHDLPPYAPLDDAARYTDGIGFDGNSELTGKSTDEANPIIIAHMVATGHLLNPPTDTIRHSYAHCWRCHLPIVFRATPQWFIGMDHAAMRTRALGEIDKTTWVPPWGHDRIYAMIANRPDWVLSRQRLWGTPIPAFYCGDCGGEHADADTMEHVATIFEREGADAWWTREVHELVPHGTKCKKCGSGSLVREKDIVDVWFESGVSWLAMENRPDGKDYKDIDLYLEGSDQHRGWFHSSMLAAVGVMGRAPYKQVITHGFVLDENGKEYSKSAIAKAKAEGKKTSYIEPESVIKQSGAELFRLWVGSIEFRNDMTYSQTILDGLTEWYRKLRNTAKFLLANLHGFDPDAHTRADVTLPVDRYMLGKLDAFIGEVRGAYERYELHEVHRRLVEFVSVDISAFYSAVVKDRLYLDPAHAPGRRAAQYVLFECLRAIVTLAAPVLCFTCEDIWKAMPHKQGAPDSVHLALFPPVGEPGDPTLANDFKTLIAWRERVNKALEPFRAAKHKSEDAAIVVAAPASDRAILERHAAGLAELFIVSSVALADGDEVTVAEHPGTKCARCWKHYDHLAASPNDVCERCAGALGALNA